MKLDLDELVRKARGATGETPGLWRAGTHEVWNVFSPYPEGLAGPSGERVVLRMNQHFDCAITAEHIAANSPPVTLALLQRILELEHALESALHTWNRHDEFDTHEPYRADLQRVLERGAVLP